jgi:histidinol dehydrogenase
VKLPLVSRLPGRHSEPGLERSGVIFLVGKPGEQRRTSPHRFAPEHLELMEENPRHIPFLVPHAGSLFLCAYATRGDRNNLAGP